MNNEEATIIRKEPFVWHGVNFYVDTLGYLWVDGGYWTDHKIRAVPEFYDNNYTKRRVELTPSDLKIAKDYLTNVRQSAERKMVVFALAEYGRMHDAVNSAIESPYRWIWADAALQLGSYDDGHLQTRLHKKAKWLLQESDLSQRFLSRFGVPFKMTWDEFMEFSDYSKARAAIFMARDKQRDTELLSLILSASEVDRKYGLAEGTARKACQREQVVARRLDGGDWIISAKAAEMQWGKTNQKRPDRS